MRYTDLFTPAHIALLVEWFQVRKELCLEIYLPHGGASSSYFTIQTLRQLKKIIREHEKYLEIEITVWKNFTQGDFESDEKGNLIFDKKWIYQHGDEVMYFGVKKNRNWSQEYHDNPEKYARYVEEWMQEDG